MINIGKGRNIIDRLGEEKMNNQGLHMCIIKYNSARDIDVIFDDGLITYDKSYSSFKRGLINNPNYKAPHFIDRLGDKNINNQGLEMKIIKYNGSMDIDVEFEDGYICYNSQYSSFKNKNIKNPNFRSPLLKDKTGEINTNYQELKMKIIKYINYGNIDIAFLNDNYIVKNTTYHCFKEGKIKNVFYPEVYGVGFIGDEKSLNDVCITKSYYTWKNMIERCYCESSLKNYPTYTECTVIKEWHNYSNFKVWFDKNYYELESQVTNLDKDILHKGNKLYSPETCIFVPQRINNLFPKSDKSRGLYPVGVNKINDKYVAECSYLNEENKRCRKKIGRFNTPEEAFYAYKKFKEQYIKEVADKYKNKIPQKLYEAMYKYKVEITD